jgi:hypothetical protein
MGCEAGRKENLHAQDNDTNSDATHLCRLFAAGDGESIPGEKPESF